MSIEWVDGGGGGIIGIGTTSMWWLSSMTSLTAPVIYGCKGGAREANDRSVSDVVLP